MSRLLRLFPPAWRAAHGEEVADMLASSGHPLADRLDLVRAGAAARLDHLHERTASMRLRVIAVALMALGVAGGLWATPQLTHGVAEIPGHWWSTLAVLPLLAGTVLALVAWWPRRHDRLA